MDVDLFVWRQQELVRYSWLDLDLISRLAFGWLGFIEGRIVPVFVFTQKGAS